MAGYALKRLMAEYKQLTLNPPDGIIAGPISEDNFFEWECLITGPDETCFENGVFPAKIIFPQDYPLSPPKMQFTCDIFHPNIYPDGRVCISILHAPGDDPTGYESSAERWSPVQSIEKILLSVVSMLAVPWYSQIPAGHPQMPFVGERSKFACLKIYDDTGSSSEDEGSKLMAKTLPIKSKNRGSQKSADKKADGGLIVHTIPQKLKNRGKKNKKAPVVEDGFLVQEGDEDYLEKKYHEDLQKAIKNSLDMASTASFQRVSVTEVTMSERQQDQANTKDAVEAQVSDADLQASILFTKTDGPQKAKEQQLVALYRSRLIETLRQLTLENEVKLKAEAEMMKYKSRYKKLCELLKDAEVNEKAHMAADLEKAQKVENELSSQIGELRGELMQARSKIRELEVKNKELSSRH